jgi:serine/threonine-protein kinase
MSSVWQAYDEELGRTVAIKLLHARRLESADSVDRFGREARTLALLAHPGIVTVIDRGETDGRPFIVCELVDGRDLHKRVSLEGRLHWRRRSRSRCRWRRWPTPTGAASCTPRRQAAQRS